MTNKIYLNTESYKTSCNLRYLIYYVKFKTALQQTNIAGVIHLLLLPLAIVAKLYHRAFMNKSPLELRPEWRNLFKIISLKAFMVRILGLSADLSD